MKNDMRKWINLAEASNVPGTKKSPFLRFHKHKNIGEWYTDDEMAEKFFPEWAPASDNDWDEFADDPDEEIDVHEKWYELVSDVPEGEQTLGAADQFFAEYALDEYSNFQIIDYKVVDGDEFYWRVIPRA